MSRRVVALLMCVAAVASLLTLRHYYSRPAHDHPPNPSPNGQAHTSVDFKRDILPILANKCFACHGPDSSTRKAHLRLDQRDFALKKTRSGATPIVPRDVEHSELVRRIFAEDDERMPPKKSGRALTDAEKALLKRWIADGA